MGGQWTSNISTTVEQACSTASIPTKHLESQNLCAKKHKDAVDEDSSYHSATCTQKNPLSWGLSTQE